MMRLTIILPFLLLLSACADVSDLPIMELPRQVKRVMSGVDDGRTDIIKCLQNQGDIVKDETTGKTRCREISGELIELRDLH